MERVEHEAGQNVKDVRNEYQVGCGNLAESREDVIRVWGNTVGWPGNQDAGYRAYYLDDEVDVPDLMLLRHVPTGRVVGTLGVSPRVVLWNGRKVRAGMLSHLCVDREHRKIRQGKLLIDAVVEACTGRYDVLYALPRTPESMAFARLMVKTMQWRLVSEGTRRVRVLRHAKYVRRLLPRLPANVVGCMLDAAKGVRSAWRGRNDRLCAEWVDAFDPRMAMLWQRSRKGSGWIAERDAKVLRWRFDRVVSRQRRYLLLRDPASSDLSAWFACDVNPYDPGILVVQDFWHEDGVNAIEQSAVRTLCSEVRRIGFAAVEMRLYAPESTFSPWVREGFVVRNRGPVYMRWLGADRGDEYAGPCHITDLDNDG